MSKSNGDTPPTIPSADLIGMANSKDAKLVKSQRPTIPPERRDKYGKWWSWKLIGHTIAQIIRREKEQGGRAPSRKQVTNGLQWFSVEAADELNRSDRLTMHRDQISSLRMLCQRRLMDLVAKNEASGGRGLLHEEITTETDAKGVTVIKRKIKKYYVQLEGNILSYLQRLESIQRLEASMDGVLAGLEIDDTPKEITINIPGLTDGGGFYLDPMQTPTDVVYDMTPPAHGLNGTNGTNGTS